MYMRISFFIFKIIKGIFAKNHNIVKNDVYQQFHNADTGQRIRDPL